MLPEYQTIGFLDDCLSIHGIGIFVYLVEGLLFSEAFAQLIKVLPKGGAGLLPFRINSLLLGLKFFGGFPFLEGHPRAVFLLLKGILQDLPETLLLHGIKQFPQLIGVVCFVKPRIQQGIQGLGRI